MMLPKHGIRINHARFDKGMRKLRPQHRNSLSEHKWIDWVQSLSARYRRIAFRQSVLDFVFFRRAPLLRRFSTQYLISTRSLYPQVQLTFQPIQLQTVWRHKYLLLPSQQESIQFLKEKDNWRQLAKLPEHWCFLRSRNMPEGQSSGRAKAKKGKNPTISKTLSSSREVLSTTLKLLSPVQLIFQRAYKVDDFVHPYHRQENIETLARVVVHRTQRIEQRSVEAVPLATRKNISAQDAAIRENPINAATNISKPRDASANLWNGNTSLAQSINIEQLTDQVVKQIDRRIIAARERMGRI